MAWTGARQLILPAALTVTTFAAVSVALSCGGSDDPTSKTSTPVVACADAPGSACERCKDAQGKVTCGPSKDCYATASGGCEPGSNS